MIMKTLWESTGADSSELVFGVRDIHVIERERPPQYDAQRRRTLADFDTFNLASPCPLLLSMIDPDYIKRSGIVEDTHCLYVVLLSLAYSTFLLPLPKRVILARDRSKRFINAASPTHGQ